MRLPAVLVGIVLVGASRICTPNEQISVCRDDIRAVADAIEFALMEHPEWNDLFTVDERNVSTTLYALASRLEERMADCPCIGPCTLRESCR